jgi:hypothetical protein
MKLVYNIKRFWKIPGIEKKLLIKGSFLTLFIIALVKNVPVKYYVFLLKSKPEKLLPKNRIPEAVKLTRKTMNRILFLLPVKHSCLTHSTVFKLLLNSLGVESNLSLGLAKKAPLQLQAHAFVKINNNIVFLKQKRYNEIISF